MDFVFFTLLLRDSFGNSFLYLVTLLFALFEPCLRVELLECRGDKVNTPMAYNRLAIISNYRKPIAKAGYRAGNW